MPRGGGAGHVWANVGESARRKEGFPVPSMRVWQCHAVDSWSGGHAARVSTHTAVRANARRNPPRMTDDVRHDAMQEAREETPRGNAMRRMLFVNDSAGRRTDVPQCLFAFDFRAAPTIISRALGVSDEEDAEAALENGEERLIDVGMAGSEVFLDNVSIGWYTDIAALWERYQRRLPRRLGELASLLVRLLRTRWPRISVDGIPERAWWVWVGNGGYSTSSTRLTDRESMESGVLDVRLLRAGARRPKLRVVVTVIKANVESSSHIVRRIAPSVTLRGSRSSVRAALDGELIVLPSPVLVTVRHRSLRVLFAPPTVDSEPSDG